MSGVYNVCLTISVLSPFVTEAVQEYTAREGEPVRILCQAVKSVPRPKFSWSLANDEIDLNPVPLALNKRITVDDDGESRN